MADNIHKTKQSVSADENPALYSLANRINILIKPLDPVANL